MLGYCALTSARRPSRPERAALWGLSLWALEVTQGRWERQRLSRGAGRLARTGVRRVLAPADFPHWDVLEAAGLRRVEPAPLLRGLAPRLALGWLACRGLDPERGVVALRGSRSGELAAPAQALCPLVGGLVLSAPGSGSLARQLRANFGLADRETGRADLALHFSPGLPDEGEPVLALWPGAPLPPGLTLSHPALSRGPACDPVPLLTALWEAGRLPLGEIVVDFA
jgi:hypothetical protein